MRMETAITRHAAARMQQRAIPIEAVELLLRFGSTARASGADTFFFDRTSRKEISETLGNNELRGAEKLLNVYAIVSDDGQVITAARRTRRLRRC